MVLSNLKLRTFLIILLLFSIYFAFISVLSFFIPVQYSIGIAVVLLLFQILYSSELELDSINAREVTEEESPALHDEVEALCMEADIQKPNIAVIDSAFPNALAIGGFYNQSTICVTTGLLEILSPEERYAVLAHEVAHLKNRDAIVMTIISAIPTVLFVMIVALISEKQLSSYVLAVVSALTWIVSFVLVRLISRKRELLADQTAVQLNNNPEALINALKKIDSQIEVVKRRTRQKNSFSHLNALFIINMSFSNILSTHPTINSRIKKIRNQY